MSTLVGESEPGGNEASPLDSITALLDANDYLMRLAIHTREQPSAEAIVITDSLKRKAIESIAPMVETKFFRTTGDRELISAATGAVMNTTIRLYKTATELRPDEPFHFGFDENVHPQIVEVLSNPNDSDQEVRTQIVHAMDMLCNTYEAGVQNLFDKVMSSDTVVMYGMDVERRAEQRRELLRFGSMALATFVGTSAAHYLFNRKR